MISAYETGKQTPSVVTLGKLLTALGANLHLLQDALDLQQVDLPQLGPPDPSESSDSS